MTYRPYPNAARAIAQLDRHIHLVKVPEWRVKMADDARRALAVGGDVVQPMVRALRDIRLDMHPDFAVLTRARHAT